MGELEEYKALVGKRLNDIGEILANIAMGDNSQKLNLFDLGDNEFGEFAFGLDTLIEDLLVARKTVEAQQTLEKRRADIWHQVATAFGSSSQIISKTLHIIINAYHVDAAAYFIAQPADSEYRLIDINANFAIDDTTDYHFPKNYVPIGPRCNSKILHLDHSSKLFSATPPTEISSISKIVKQRDFSSMWALFVYDESTKSQIALLIGKNSVYEWTKDEEQNISALAYISFARYYQLRSQEEMQRINLNLATEVSNRTHELANLNRRLQRDLLEQETAKVQIRENMEAYRTLIETIPDPIITITSTWQIVSANKNAVSFFGFEKVEDLCQHYLRDFCNPSDLIKINKNNGSGEVQFHALNGRTTICELKITKLNQSYSLPHNTLLCILHDITERRKHEQEMTRIQSLESLGILAGGIAHDFNNILSGIAGNLYLANKLQEKNPQKSAKLLETAHQSIIRAKSLTGQLLTFSKGGAPVKQLLDFKDVLNESIAFALAGSEVACHINLKDELLLVEGDRSQLTQIFTNLLLNGAQETTDATLLLEAESVHLPEDNQFNLASGNYLHITIADRGRGIAPEVAPYIFHPFYTTKPNGTGLGLTIVHSIVTNHSGTIFFEPRTGGGTIFHVYLPASTRVTALHNTSESVKSLNDNNTLLNGLRVLCMDDDDTIRDMIFELLSYLGCAPRVVSNGEEAIAAYKQALQEDHGFQAVILDLTIGGGMGGKETMTHLLEIDPDVYGIVVSGYCNDPVMAHYQDFGFRDILSKPYTIDELKLVMLHVINKG